MKPKTIADLLELLEPSVRAAFLAAVDDVKSEAQLRVIVAALQDGRIDDAMRGLQFSPAFFAPLDDAIRDAHLQGGRNALLGVPVLPDPFLRGAWSFASMAATIARKRG